MIRFNCDYSEGAHPRILKMLTETNFEQTTGYGEDPHCTRARELILRECGNPDADLYFLVGGTQTNLTVIASALRPYQGVLSAVSGHINVHESGAIEATGHKVLALASEDGKITAEQVEKAYRLHHEDETRIHMVQPKMVYISHPTEVGTIYTKAELSALYDVCRKRDLYLFIDGARMGYGLTAPGTDLTLKDISKLCDVFYIGGTKVGALFGEALIILNSQLKTDFPYMIKQRGGLLAKGRLLGIQFETLFEDGLYYELGTHANKTAQIIKKACEDKGLAFLCQSPTNQQFPIMPNSMLAQLSKKYSYADMGRIDEDHTAVRFCTSWATPIEDAEQLAKDIASL
ncbi:MAG: aminotransferase class I/II-fold pyridoxal phosphate-dependent enzyme [Clostridiaceae bacterium]|nr:aminotransferase class I/II-fold pyridoxal phosphate-dependent enzyme [Clostridiaceae bacterium]